MQAGRCLGSLLAIGASMIEKMTFEDPSVRHTARRISALAQDLKAIRRGFSPTVEQLAFAPRLEGWDIAFRMELALIGELHGHPELPNGRVTTSSLFILDPELGYARTLSRFYVLGRRKA